MKNKVKHTYPGPACRFMSKYENYDSEQSCLELGSVEINAFETKHIDFNGSQFLIVC